MLTLCTNSIKNQMPKIFNNIFERSTHKYPAQFSEVNFKYKRSSLTSSKYLIFCEKPNDLE